LIAAIRRPALPRVPAGLPGTGPVRLLDVNGGVANARRISRRPAKQWLAVADAPLARYGEASINRRLSDLDWVSRAALAHESVVESFIGALGQAVARSMLVASTSSAQHFAPQPR
jgi:hypothetical protein